MQKSFCRRWFGPVNGKEQMERQTSQFLEHNLHAGPTRDHNPDQQCAIPTGNGVSDISYKRGPLPGTGAEAGRVAV